MINVFQPSLGDEELNAVQEVFKSNWIGKGKKVDSFENDISCYLQTERLKIRSVSSCTAGMFLIIKLLGIKNGDEVILPTISFVGAANAICDSGAKAVFCDVDPRTLNVTLFHIQQKITSKTKAIILIHYGGIPVDDIDDIVCFCADKNIILIEDNACSVASVYKGKHCGTIGDFGVFSFDAMKILVMGDGGIVYSKNMSNAIMLGKMAYLGLESISGINNKNLDKWWEFEISTFGNRQIINDISASIGIEQLKKLDGFIEKRKKIHEIYTCELSDLNWLLLPPTIPEYVKSSYYFYWVQSEYRDLLATYLRQNGIYTTFRYYPLHMVKYYGCNHETLINAENACRTTLCLPIHQSLSSEDMSQIVTTIRKFK